MHDFICTIKCQAYRYHYTFPKRGYPSVHVAVLLDDADDSDVALEALFEVFYQFDDVQVYVTHCERAFFELCGSAAAAEGNDDDDDDDDADVVDDDDDDADDDDADDDDDDDADDDGDDDNDDDDDSEGSAQRLQFE